MVTVFIGLAVAAWLSMGVKTWSFGLSDLADADPNRSAVYAYFFVGILWPLTYALLAMILILGVNSQPLDSSFATIMKAWRTR